MPVSIARSLERRAGRVARVAQWLIAAIVIGFAARELAQQWSDVAPALRSLRIDWLVVAASGALVLSTYLLLIEAWRRTLRVWSASVPFPNAARIWFVSNLGKYVPGKVWQIAAMGAMAQRDGVGPAAAIGSSLVVNLVNVIAGFAVIALTAGGEIASAVGVSGEPGSRGAAALTVLMITIGGVAALVITPFAVPRLASLAARVTGRSFVVPRVPASAIWIAAATTTLSWVLYGLAFGLFAHGVSRAATGNASSYIAVYTGSYLAGYLALFAPGGVGVREAVLVLAMPRFQLASAADAAVIAVASRLWLTVLEIVPGLLLLRRPWSTTAQADHSDDS
jgi:glycosyltransferase 2 family protein